MYVKAMVSRPMYIQRHIPLMLDFKIILPAAPPF